MITGEELALWRYERGMSQSEAAQTIGITRQTWAKYERLSAMPIPRLVENALQLKNGLASEDRRTQS